MSSAPDFWEQARTELAARDRIMARLIPQFGDAHIMARGDAFRTLAQSVLSQQISAKAAEATWLRLLEVCPACSPEQILATDPALLSACGLSKRKLEYLLDLAQRLPAMDRAGWQEMDDESVIAQLMQVRGIGRWTAEMFLIFNLQRPNVLPLDDAALIRSISLNYFSGEPVSRSDAREVAANWEPWRSVAVWYMWQSLEPLPIA
ncbi:DNA-3-methyladenine glycosylase 2 family protein [Massilia sp. W12]|uniref:DNA-3-methyladenine glycosylase family protein n=1 Tax=Massilia sp. W12 TaxID=3126507 RepID=UPI0030D2759B